MVDQALPNDILRLIFSQLNSVRFICRKIPRLNSEWRYWAASNIRSLVIHPRDNYKRSINEIYGLLIKNASLTFPNVKELSICNPIPGQLAPLLAKFPKLEKLKFHAADKVLRGRDGKVEIAEISSHIKELIIEDLLVHIPATVDPNLPSSPIFSQLQVYNGPGFCNQQKYFPAALRELNINDKHSWYQSSWTASELTTFTALEVLRIKNQSESITEYLKTSPQRLRDLFVHRVGIADVPYLSQRNLPALKRLKLGDNKILNAEQFAEYKGMEIIEQRGGQHIIYDAQFFQNNPDLIRLRLFNQARQVPTWNQGLKNLKELILTGQILPSITMKKVLSIPTLEKLHFINGSILILQLGNFLEEQDGVSSQIEPNYNIKELTIKDVTMNLSAFMRSWAQLFHGLVKVKFFVTPLRRKVRDEINSICMKSWTRLEEIEIFIDDDSRDAKKGKWHFPVFPNLRTFKAGVVVDDDIFETLARSPNLEIACAFELGPGSTSAFLLENKVYGLLKASRSLYCLVFTTRIPFKLVRERVASFVMPEASLRISYVHGGSDKKMFDFNA